MKLEDAEKIHDHIEEWDIEEKKDLKQNIFYITGDDTKIHVLQHTPNEHGGDER